jgi:hypothetical protein
MKTLIVILVLLGATSVHADARRYVVATKVAGKLYSEHPLWATKYSPIACVEARLKGLPDGIRRFCEDGFTGGEKSRIGTLRVGDEIELIDSRECGEIMSRVRVIKGKLSGELGCMASDALSTVKP